LRFAGNVARIINVAPNSPSALAKPRMYAAASDLQAIGMVMCRNTRHSFAPSHLALFSRSMDGIDLSRRMIPRNGYEAIRKQGEPVVLCDQTRFDELAHFPHSGRNE
jgi:hypothetical protein